MLTATPSPTVLTGWTVFPLMDPAALWKAFQICDGVVKRDTDVRETAAVVQRLEPYLEAEGLEINPIDRFIPELKDPSAKLGCPHLLGIADSLRRYGLHRATYLRGVDRMLRESIGKEEGFGEVRLFQIGVGWHRHYREVFEAIQQYRGRLDRVYRWTGIYMIVGGLCNLAWIGPTWETLFQETDSILSSILVTIALFSAGMISSSIPLAKRRREVVGSTEG